MADFFSSSELIRDKTAKSLSYYCTEDVVRIDNEIIAQLVQESAKKGNCNARICLHTSPGSNFHEMIILQRTGRYYRPHKHLQKGESCHIIEGKVAVLVFTDEGSIAHYCIVGRNENLICRVGTNQWHTVIPITEYAVYHESKPGPYLGETDSVYPAWAPDGSDMLEAGQYMDKLLSVFEEGLFLK